MVNSISQKNKNINVFLFLCIRLYTFVYVCMRFYLFLVKIDLKKRCYIYITKNG